MKFNFRKRNIALKISYDGTNYNGVQCQNPPNVLVQNILKFLRADFFAVVFVGIICAATWFLSYEI